MKKILFYILICSPAFMCSMELQRPLLLDYTFAVCPPENLIENLQQHACTAKNFDKTGKLFQELLYDRFSTQDLEYLVEVVTSGKQVSAVTASHHAVGNKEEFRYASVAMILQQERLLDCKNGKLQKALDEDRQKYILRKKNILLYLNPFNKNNQQAGQLYWKLLQDRTDRRNRNTLYPECNQLLPTFKLDDQSDVFEDDSDNNDMTSKLLADLENYFIDEGLMVHQEIDLSDRSKENVPVCALCSSVIPSFVNKFTFHEGVSLDVVDKLIFLSSEYRYSSTIAKLNNELIAIDKNLEYEKKKLVQRLARAIECRNNSCIVAHSNSSKSVRWDQPVKDSKPTQKNRRQRRRKK